MYVDPEIAPFLIAQADFAAANWVVLPERVDALALRAMAEPGLQAMLSALPEARDVTLRTFETSANDLEPIELRWYARTNPLAGPAVVYAHGGGMFCGALDNYDNLLRHYAQLTGVPVPGRRLPPSPGGARSGAGPGHHAGVRWLVERAAELGVDAKRIAVMRDSGGGGIAAGAAILARDDGLELAMQILA